MYNIFTYPAKNHWMKTPVTTTATAQETRLHLARLKRATIEVPGSEGSIELNEGNLTVFGKGTQDLLKEERALLQA